MKRLRILMACGALAALMASPGAQAQNTADPWVAQMDYFGMPWCPRGWMQTDGKLLAISSNSALFSLIGTIYGGDGRTTFALPDLRGRVPLAKGRSPGLSDYSIGAKGGAEQTFLTVSTMPSHTHAIQMRASSSAGVSDVPTGRLLGDYDVNQQTYTDPPPDVSMDASAITVFNTGGNIPFSQMQPTLAVNMCMAVYGIFPSRN